MDAVTKAVNAALQANEDAFSLAAIDKSFADVEALGEKSAELVKPQKKSGKGKRAKVVTETPANDSGKPVSKYQKKGLAKKGDADAVSASPTPAVAVETKPAEVAGISIDLLMEGLEADIAGGSKEDWDQMLAFRAEGYRLIEESSRIRVHDLEVTARSQARELSNRMPKKARALIFDELMDSNTPKSRLMLDVLGQLKEEFDRGKDADPVQKQKFIDIMLAAVNRDPVMKRMHEENVAEAENIMGKFEEAKAKQKALYEEGVLQLELANEIAKDHGWPMTQAKKGTDAKTK